MRRKTDLKRLRKQVLIFLIILLLGLWNLKAQTVYSEDFSASPQGAMTSPKWEVEISKAAPDIFWVQNQRFECKNVKGEGIWSSSLIDISGVPVVNASVSLAENGSMEAGDFIRVYYNLDGRGELLFSANGNQEGRFGAAAAKQTGITGSVLQIVIHVRNNDFNEKHSFDNILVAAQPAAVVWTGMVDTLWSEPGNWSTGKAPAARDEALIKSAATLHPVITGAAECGTLTIEKNATLRLSPAALLDLNGSFHCFGKFFSPNATVRFSGSEAQGIESAQPVSFHNLEIENHSEEGVSAGKISIRNRLSLKDGRFVTTDTITVENTTPEAIAAYSDSSYVIGKLQRKITATENARYAFPVGIEGVYGYHPAWLDAHALEGTHAVTASFHPLERTVASELQARGDDFVYDYVAPEGMWTLAPDSEPAGGWYDIRLSLKNLSGFADNLFGILKRPQGSGTKEWSAAFGNENAFGGEGRRIADGYALKMYCNSFSEFTIGGGGVPIPIELLHFGAELTEGKVNVQWSTATESDNAWFTIEKSNGTDFKEVVRIKSEGNSSERKNYSAVDEKPFTGVSYYRLKQTDLNGQAEFSNIVAVNNESNANQIVVFPNPAEGSVKLKFSSALPKAEVVVYNQHGTISYNKTFSIQGGSSVVELPLKEELAPGVYYMQVTADRQDLLIQQIVIQ